MKKSLFLLIPILFAACSPRIATTVIKQQPAVPATQTVSVFNNKEQIPTGYEVLGTVSALDGGMTVNCDSLIMISLLKEKTREMGGNAVLITEHRRPSFWTSTCHQFKAVVLNLSDEIDKNKQDAIFDNAILTASKQRNFSRFILSANVGPAWKGGDIPDTDYYERKMIENLKSGYQMNVSADYFFSDNYGIRLAYQRFSSTADERIPGGDTWSGEFVLNAVYPAFVMRVGTNNQKWLFDLSFGIGYVDFFQSTSLGSQNLFEVTGSNVGAQFTLGAQYLVTKNLGIGAILTSTGGSLGKVKVNGVSETLENNERIGLNQTGILFGLRYHIR